MAPALPQTSSADGVTWDLHDLYSSVDDPRITHDLDSALQRAQAFEAAYRGQINIEGGPPPEVLLTALHELESLFEQMDRPTVYASLVHAAKTDDPRHGALLVRTREQRTVINKHLIFFDLEWVKLADAPAHTLIHHPLLAKYRHYLEQKRAWRPHYLSEPEEKILEEKAVTGRAAFVRLFDETVASLKFPFVHDGRTDLLSLQQINAKLYDADRGVRQASAVGLTRGLQENARLLTFVFNNLVLDHKSDCELRHFTSPMAPRHLANEITDAVVDALMTAAERHHGTVQRYYRLKGRLLGLEPLYDYDRYAPLFPDLPTCDWPTARRTVLESYEAFSPRAGAVIREFFDKSWIDAALRTGKRGGAFSSSAVPSAHPYILMNYTDKLRDVMTLAHELGHGLHQYLSRPVGYLQCDTPLTTAEMASVFGEMLTFQRLQTLYSEPRIRLAMLCSKIEDGFATVFRQVVLTRFEQAFHRARREQGEQTTEQLNELWLAASRPMHGDVVQLTADYGWWWLYIGHFIHVPFYCYAYAFGELLVLALVQKYKQEGPRFVPRYLDLLSAGGSDAPHVLLGRLDVDVTDPGFWELGLRLLGDMVAEAEALAARLEAR
jgi:oligoendopeptidase F